MVTTEELEMYCRNCVSRDFVNEKGLVCKRTRELPTFEGECENFEKDVELEKIAPPKPDDFPESMTREELIAEESLAKGVTLAVVACIVGALAWGMVSISTGRQMGIMAIGIGFIVGFAMRQGKGVRPIFGIIGAALALISCVLGDFISIVGFAAEGQKMSFMEVLSILDYKDYKEISSVMAENVLSMTALFYGLAIYEGYKFSFRKQNQPKGGQI